MPGRSVRRIADALNRDREGGLRAPKKPCPEIVPASAEELARDHLRTGVGLEASRQRIAAALAVPCPLHSADAGESCWRGPKGYCIDRLAAGLDRSPLAFRVHQQHTGLTASIGERLDWSTP